MSGHGDELVNIIADQTARAARQLGDNKAGRHLVADQIRNLADNLTGGNPARAFARDRASMALPPYR